MSQLLRHFASISGSLIAISSAYGQPIAAPEPVFSKVFGGSSGWDFADSIAVDSQGNAVVAGTTNSPDFPLTNAIQPKITQPPLIVNAGNGVSAYPQLGPAVDVTALAESADGAAVYAASSSGIFRSLDGGVTWSQQLPGLTGANTLAVDSASADILYAGVPQVQGISAAGFFKSVDGGQHWTPVNLAGVSNSAGIYSLATTPLAPGTVYAQIKALYRSRDGGTTWTALGPNGYFIYAFGQAPSDPNIIYAVASDGLVYRSADGGDTWSASGAKFGNAYPSPMASAVAVDPLDRNTVWIVAGDNLFKSMDAGATFQVVFNSKGLLWLSLSRTQGRILASTRGTAWASLDSGVTWKAIAQQVYLNTSFAGRSNFFAGTSASTDGFVTKWSADGTQILFSTFLSGARNLFAAEDLAGNTYVTGVTASPLFPVTSGTLQPSNGSGNLFLTKFDPSGNLQFSELLGLGGPTAITIGSNGDVFLAGAAPGCTNTGNPTPLALRLDSRGHLIYSRLFTESCSGLTQVSGIAVDASGDLYLAGSTTAADLPTTATAIEPLYSGANSTVGFLARLAPQGDAITYLSYLGGGSSSAGGIAIDSTGNIYVSGGSNDFPSTIQTTSDLTIPATCGSSFARAFVVKLSPSSNIPLWLTKWGAGCDNVSGSIALDGHGNIWAGGLTRSSYFPMVSPLLVRGVSDRFVTEFSPDGTKILFSSFVVGNFALGPKDSLYIGGSVIPYPRKLDSLQITGVAGPTSVLVERVDTGATRTDVIESITNLNPAAYDQDPLFFWIGPGEMIRISGHGLGPAVAAGAQLDSSGRVSTSVAGTRILFDGVPAPLISVQESAVVCITPFAIGGRAATSVQIERNGAAAPGVGVAVRTVSAQPDVLAIANQGGAANSQSNPAHAGQTVTLYVTGFGDTIPSVPDRSIYQSPLPVPAVPLFGSYPYAGPAPGEVAGVWQINVPVPTGTTGNPVQVQVLSQPMSGGIYPRVNASIWVAP